MRSITAGLGLALAMAACAQSADSAATAAALSPASLTPASTPVAAKRAPHADAATHERIRNQLGSLVTCRSELDCPGFDALLDLGDVAAPDVLAYVADGAVQHGHGDARRMAARVLGRLHYAPAGPQLVAIGNGEPDVMAQIDLLKAAGECGGAQTFDALAFEFDREQPGAPGEHLVALRDGLRAFHDRALPWALVKVTRGGAGADKYADVLCDVAKPQDRDTLVQLVGKTMNYRADDRLAAKALVLGATDAKLYDTLLAGLESETPADRDDAATLLRVIAPRLPTVRKAKAVELIRRAIPHADPALASNLQASLQGLGG